MRKHEPGRGFYSLVGYGGGETRDALVALAMVVGAHVEKRVVLAVVPPYYLLAVGIGDRGSHRGSTAANLPQHPTARYHGMGFEKFYRRGGIHLRRDDAPQVVLHIYMVDYHYLAIVGHKLHGAVKPL